VIKSFRTAFTVSALWVALLWVIQVINLLSGYKLNSWGIHPRELSGLGGILLAPFLHAGFYHLISNSVPMLILLALVYMSSARALVWVSISGILLGGLGVWVLGSNGYHVGASGLIFAFWGYLIADAWFRRSVWSILISVITLLLYGGLLFSLFSYRPYVSFSSHLFGLLAGVITARLLAPPGRAGLAPARSPNDP